jgi:hypothetical protein
VPRVCDFYGMQIYIYYDDHEDPHFHALYAGHEVQVRVENRSIMAGRLPPRAKGPVLGYVLRPRLLDQLADVLKGLACAVGDPEVLRHRGVRYFHRQLPPRPGTCSKRSGAPARAARVVLPVPRTAVPVRSRPTRAFS